MVSTRFTHPPPCAVFDLDGTLVDTAADMIAGANAALAAAGASARLDPDADASISSGGGRAMLRAGFARAGGSWSEADVEAAFPAFLAAYERGIDVASVVFPGAAGAVARLRARGWVTAVCTNKPERLARLLLGRLGLLRHFDALVGADTLPVRKPDPAPLVAAVRRAGGDIGRAVLIGDTATDRDTARAAGVASVLVTFGPAGADVAALAPDALLHRYADLGALLDGLIGGAAPRAAAAD